jgi:hypothetical protein
MLMDHEVKIICIHADDIPKITFFLGATAPLVGLGFLIHEVCFSRSPTTGHHSRYDSSGRVISSLQRPLPDNTQHSH